MSTPSLFRRFELDGDAYDWCFRNNNPFKSPFDSNRDFFSLLNRVPQEGDANLRRSIDSLNTKLPVFFDLFRPNNPRPIYASSIFLGGPDQENINNFIHIQNVDGELRIVEELKETELVKYATFPIHLTQVGGSDGSVSAAASWTYDIEDIDGKSLGTAVDIDSAPHNWVRPTLGKMVQATAGLAHYEGETLVVDWVNEREAVEECSGGELLAAQSGSSDPTASEFSDGEYGIFKNTTSGNVFLTYNDGGTIKKVTLT